MIFTAPEDQLPEIKTALAVAPPETIALSTDGKRVLSTGTLALINNQVDTTSGTIRLKAVFDNKDHALWPGQSVSTRLLVATERRHRGSRRRGPARNRRTLRFTVNEETRPQSQDQGGALDGRALGDLWGLSPGEQVITAGQYKVQPGTLVTTAVASSDTKDKPE